MKWCMGAIVADEDSVLLVSCGTANRLLHARVELWVTIRGFSFFSGWMELYKQEAQRSLQRSKGLHKALFTDNA